jgi:hypothetical protein
MPFHNLAAGVGTFALLHIPLRREGWTINHMQVRRRYPECLAIEASRPTPAG